MDDPYHYIVDSNSHSIQRDGATHLWPAAHPDAMTEERFCFSYSTPNHTGDTNSFEVGTQERSKAQQLQPLVMPKWPSMIGSQSISTCQPGYSSQVQPMQPVILGTLQTPVSGTSTGPASTGRRYLTDKQKKQICEYAEKHRNSKQTEIGGVYYSFICG